MPDLDETHDPARQSIVAAANDPATDFPIQNLPYGVFSAGDAERRVGVAIGDRILDLTALERDGRLVPSPSGRVFDRGALNPLMAEPQSTWSAVRAAIAHMLDARTAATDLPLVPIERATLHRPFEVRGFTDFYAAKEHAVNVGTMFRGKENALPANWLHIPIGYNGRASTVVVSGVDIHRPNGQTKRQGEAGPRFGPSEKLDLEVELGAVVGTPSGMGRSLSPDVAYAHIFGYVLLNDWSARDIQVWEYQPLGPFQSKSFATSISPWVVTREALEPFRVPAPPRQTPLLPYLEETTANNLDISIEVALAPGGKPMAVVSRTNARHLYYSSAQQLAHHTSSGCAMETGDLLGSGTISGPTRGSVGSLLELTWNGTEPITVSGVKRAFLEDGDTVELRGWCEGERRIGFGRCTTTVLPAARAETR